MSAKLSIVIMLIGRLEDWLSLWGVRIFSVWQSQGFLFLFVMPGLESGHWGRPSPSCNKQVSPPAAGALKYNNKDTSRCPGHPVSLLHQHAMA